MSAGLRIVAFAILLSSSLVRAAGNPPGTWHAGTARNKITPTEPIWLSGYEVRDRPDEGVLRDIYVKALALRNGTGPAAVLVTADILGFTREAADAVAERCRKEFGITRDRLVLNASHTHSAPVIYPPDWPEHPPMPASQLPVLKRYAAFLEDRTVAAVGEALKSMAPAYLRFGQGFAGIGVNRRRDVMGRNLTGQVDQDVPVLAVARSDGRLLALVAGYSCHATVLNGYLVNGDWPGFAQEEIERRHPGTMAMFVQGCAADINPLPRRSVALAQMYGQILAAAVDGVLSGDMSPVAGPLKSAYGLVDLPFHDVPTRAQLELDVHSKDDYRRWGAQRMLAILNHGKPLPDHYAYPIEVWCFATDLKFIVLGGEVVSDYCLRLKRQYGFDDTWVAGYSNDVFGYVGSRRVIQEGGYEGGDANTNFPAPFSPAIEELIVEKTAQLMRRAED
jgi:Neutral/alkaline non-lysosomal ceramidase, N-terminal